MAFGVSTTGFDFSAAAVLGRGAGDARTERSVPLERQEPNSVQRSQGRPVVRIAAIADAQSSALDPSSFITVQRQQQTIVATPGQQRSAAETLLQNNVSGIVNGRETSGNSVAEGELTPEQQAQVRELQARDREVRAHEAAHAAAGGEFAGSPTFEFTTGPDGQQYAVSGEVSIDTAPISGDPAATIDKLQAVVRAANAPAEPSGQDRAVAAAAAANLAIARAELSASQSVEPASEDDTENSEPAVTNGQIESSQTESSLGIVSSLNLIV